MRLCTQADSLAEDSDAGRSTLWFRSSLHTLKNSGLAFAENVYAILDNQI